MEINFTGRLGGDCECFCFHLFKEEYIKLFGRKEYDLQVKYYGELEEVPVYPNQLLSLIHCNNHETVNLTIRKN